ncbi:hypothetical protein [Zavarzinella formosa]|uniref:hypothetical protein n=1 Tax=Zavarzinella formosa TaxID=360055 RepID=UPI0003166076|nr:hypothetical protein [Zavarzinella formosa]
MNKVPALQDIDYLLGKHACVEQAVPGWYVYAADTLTLFPNGRAGVMTACPSHASEVAEFIATHSKFGPFIHDAWLHTQQAIRGDVVKHPHWTPR